MSWLPTFLSPWTAAIAAAAAIPALLVLYFLKLRRREFEVSSTLLWKKTIQDLQVNAPFQRLRKNLLLLLQMLLLVLLLLALARPVLHGGQVAGKVSVILIDRSGSMAANDVEGHSRLHEAKRQAKALVDTMDRDSAAMVIAFDSSAEPVQAFTSDKAKLKAAIDRIQQTDRLSQLERAYSLSEMQALSHDAEQRRPGGDIKAPDIFLFSDGRVSDSARLALRTATLHYSRIGNPDSRNIAIVSLSAKRRYEQPAEVTVFARFANYGPEPAEDVGVTLSVDGQVQRVDQKLLLLPERWTDEQRQAWVKQHGKDPRPSVEFNLELVTGATLRVQHTATEGDALPADNAAQIIVPPPRSLSALIVTADNYFLQRAIDSMDLKSKDLVKPVKFEELMKSPAKLAAQYDLVVFDRYWPKQLPPGANFIYFASLPPNTRLKPAMDGAQRLMLKDVGVLDWQRDHPMVRNLNLQRLYIGETMRIEREEEKDPVPTTRTETLVEGTAGPLVLLHTEAGCAHLVVSFDLLQSNWPLRPSFPAFLHNAMRYMALGAEMDLRQSLQPGATPTIPRHNLQQAGVGDTLKIKGPVARDVTIPDSGDVALPALDKVGMYETSPAVPQFEKIAVNLLDDNESNILPVDIPPGMPADKKAENLTGAARTRTELWWWILACAAIPLCLIEWWVYTRRVHL